jgi:hypothetical protein
MRTAIELDIKAQKLHFVCRKLCLRASSRRFSRSFAYFPVALTCKVAVSPLTIARKVSVLQATAKMVSKILIFF